MSRSSNPLFFAAGLALSPLLLTGCGGASDEPASTQVASAASVRIEGCVVDQYYVPNEGVPVRVTSADGRVLANARSGRMGEFVVQVPAGAAASMAVDRAEGDQMQTPALDRDRVVDACLVARN